MKKRILFLSFLLLVLNNSFSQNSKESVQKYKALSQKVYDYFKDDSDPKKKRAIEFLLRGMLYHSSGEPYWLDSNNRKTDLSEFQYETFEEAKIAFNLFKKKGGKQKIRYIKDVEQIDADFLIKNIEDSFKIWEESPWYKFYSFENFCEYILPYRSSLEPVEENWKSKYLSIYKTTLYEEYRIQNPVDVCANLINALNYIEFVSKRDFPQPMLSIDQLHFRGQGNCTDIANTVLLLGRSLGLAITYDFTPYYGASSNSHYWNAILDRDGNFIPFNGNGQLPYVYNAANKRLGKVLRQTFSANKEALIYKVPFEQIPSKKLSKHNVIDVTDQYVATSNVFYKFNTSIPNNIAYITVFNQGEWRPLWWGPTNANNETVFKKMGRDIVYLPSATRDTIVKKKRFALLKPEKHPILLKNNGSQQILKPDFINTFNTSISRKNEKSSSFKDYNTLELVNNEYYNLYYWSGKWKLFGRTKCINKSLSFKDVPRNTLFRVVPDKSDSFERIFIINNKTKQLTWY